MGGTWEAEPGFSGVDAYIRLLAMLGTRGGVDVGTWFYRLCKHAFRSLIIRRACMEQQTSV